MDTLVSLRAFATVAELRSFTAAAGRLSLSPAMVSKHVTHIENRVGARLLNRTSRHVSLTETGGIYLAQVRRLLEGLDETEAEIGNVAAVPRGTLRVTAPVWIASPLMARGLAEYRRRYPAVSLDLHFGGRMVNLVDDGYDLALRATAPDRLDPGLIARPLTEVAFHLLSSPGYLDRMGEPRSAGELAGHALLIYSGIGNLERLLLKEKAGTQGMRFDIALRSENETMLHLAALEGMGMAFLPLHLAQQDIDAGRLRRVLSDELAFKTTLHAVYPSRRHLSAKVRTFIDFFAEWFDHARYP